MIFNYMVPEIKMTFLFKKYLICYTKNNKIVIWNTLNKKIQFVYSTQISYLELFVFKGIIYLQDIDHIDLLRVKDINFKNNIEIGDNDKYRQSEQNLIYKINYDDSGNINFNNTNSDNTNFNNLDNSNSDNTNFNNLDNSNSDNTNFNNFNNQLLDNTNFNNFNNTNSDNTNFNNFNNQLLDNSQVLFNESKLSFNCNIEDTLPEYVIIEVCKCKAYSKIILFDNYFLIIEECNIKLVTVGSELNHKVKNFEIDKYGICTKAVVNGDNIYFSTDTGKILRISDFRKKIEIDSTKKKTDSSEIGKKLQNKEAKLTKKKINSTKIEINSSEIETKLPNKETNLTKKKLNSTKNKTDSSEIETKLPKIETNLTKIETEVLFKFDEIIISFCKNFKNDDFFILFIFDYLVKTAKNRIEKSIKLNQNNYNIYFYNNLFYVVGSSGIVDVFNVDLELVDQIEFHEKVIGINFDECIYFVLENEVIEYFK
ncbi:hypothetical protein DMUE_1104 [Dictyocoela muelleri]|nr:hypothetical protein DMUE_1104 [Dictyocoela muelleri]